MKSCPCVGALTIHGSKRNNYWHYWLESQQPITSWLNWPMTATTSHISTDDSQFTWPRRWLLLRLSKRHSMSTTTVLFGTTLTRTITLDRLLILLGSNHFQWWYMVTAMKFKKQGTLTGPITSCFSGYAPSPPPKERTRLERVGEIEPHFWQNSRALVSWQAISYYAIQFGLHLNIHVWQ